MTERNPATYLATHPRLIGTVFTALLLFTAVKPAAAVGAVAHYGP